MSPKVSVNTGHSAGGTDLGRSETFKRRGHGGGIELLLVGDLSSIVQLDPSTLLPGLATWEKC